MYLIEKVRNANNNTIYEEKLTRMSIVPTDFTFVELYERFFFRYYQNVPALMVWNHDWHTCSFEICHTYIM